MSTRRGGEKAGLDFIITKHETIDNMETKFTQAEHHALYFFRNAFESEREHLKLANTKEAFIHYYKTHVEPLGLGNAIATQAFNKLSQLNDEAWRET